MPDGVEHGRHGYYCDPDAKKKFVKKVELSGVSPNPRAGSKGSGLARLPTYFRVAEPVPSRGPISKPASFLGSFDTRLRMVNQMPDAAFHPEGPSDPAFSGCWIMAKIRLVKECKNGIQARRSRRGGAPPPAELLAGHPFQSG